ncbi:MAG: DUF2971 domain-containing protein [Acidobacteria bacterium]|nr:DUF2971 domain-containing protein [Acidobacteriota bacterium]
MFEPRVPTCSHFYKYSTADHLERLRHVLLKHEIYFPSHPQLNDPRDGWAALKQLPVEDVTRFVVNDFIRRHAAADLAWLAHEVAVITYNTRRFGAATILQKMEILLRQESERNRIYSLSMARESAYMWKEYGGNHTGYCLEFANEGLFRHALEVHYDDDVAALDVNNPHNFFMYRKTTRWQDEQEARLVMFPRGGPVFFEMFKNGEHPFVSFAPTLLRRVILGKRMTMSNRDQIRGWAAERDCPVLIAESEVDRQAVVSESSAAAT